jgi:hypothetical protein
MITRERIWERTFLQKAFSKERRIISPKEYNKTD